MKEPSRTRERAEPAPARFTPEASAPREFGAYSVPRTQPSRSVGSSTECHPLFANGFLIFRSRPRSTSNSTFSMSRRLPKSCARSQFSSVERRAEPRTRIVSGPSTSERFTTSFTRSSASPQFVCVSTPFSRRSGRTYSWRLRSSLLIRP